eukprot:949037_1
MKRLQHDRTAIFSDNGESIDKFVDFAQIEQPRPETDTVPVLDHLSTEHAGHIQLFHEDPFVKHREHVQKRDQRKDRHRQIVDHRENLQLEPSSARTFVIWW